MSLEKIILPVKNRINEFDQFYKSIFSSKGTLLNSVVSYIVKSSGKKLRPALVFLSAELCGEFNKNAFNGAALVEMLHNATLIHDDVVDDANHRRGLASVRALWNNKTAVLVGDYFLAKGLITAIESNEYEFLKVILKSVKRMSEGELLSLEASKSMKIDESIYFEVTSNKTASLLSNCCEIGAISSNASQHQRNNLAQYGENMGIAFQLRDDVFDYISDFSIIGKPTGRDIEEKKITLPLIYAINNATQSDGNRIIKILKKKKITKEDTKLIIDFAVSNGGIEYTMLKAKEYSDKAIMHLQDFPDNQYKKVLIDIAKFVYTRDK